MSWREASCRPVVRLLLCCWVFVSLGCDEREPPSAAELLSIRTMGLAYLEENRLAEAQTEFQKLIEIAPDEPLGHANLGLVYLRMGQFADAEAQIDRALRLAPTDPGIRLIQAKIYEQTDREAGAIAVLQGTLEQGSDHIKTLYAISELYRNSRRDDADSAAERFLRRLVDRAPGNIAARLQLTEQLVRNGKADDAAAQLEEIGRQVPELPQESVDSYDRALELLRASQAQEALAPTVVVHNVLRVTSLYQAGVLDLQGPGGALIGFPILSFSQNVSLQTQDESAVLAALRFVDVTGDVGLDVVAVGDAGTGAASAAAGAGLAVGDYDGDGDQDVYLLRWRSELPDGAFGLYRNESGRFVHVSRDAGVRHSHVETAAMFADYDNDGWLDLYVVGDHASTLYRNRGDGTFDNVTRSSGVEIDGTGLTPLFADLDHDGDLDLFLGAAGTNWLFRNNLDGTFVERAAAMGLAGNDVPTLDGAFGDFDEDGDLDVFVVNGNAGNALFTNLRQGRFEDVAESSGVGDGSGSIAVAVGDYDNDGFLDLFVANSSPDRHRFYRNNGDGTFESDARAADALAMIQDVSASDATFLDFDNDGFIDLLVAGQGDGPSLRLLRNVAPGEFEDQSALLPENLPAVNRVVPFDFNEDGDIDLLVATSDGGVRLLRNDGGNGNRYVRLQLRGLSTGSGKNNYFGIGAKVEVRAGDHYQMRVVSEPLTLFGLGQRLKADAIRIVWTNGVPQNLFYPGSDQDLVEEQILKGSCAFLYTWDGERYTFATDVMWKSALGMPLGIMGGRAAYAPPDASREFLKIPGDLLKPRDGVYSLQITEELWETAYLDEIKLLAVDHPESTDVFVDERFVSPAVPPELRVFEVTNKHLLLRATDERGNDLLPHISEKDDVYVANLKPGRYQGITELHDLILDLGPIADGVDVTLFLQGWLFPSDASINVAVAQSADAVVVPPYLQVMNSDGKWHTVDESLSFPSGKNKTVVVDLAGKFLTSDRRVRIRTNMEIYWDHIFYSVGVSAASVVTATMKPRAADLHYRGFSAIFRKGGRYGPHWFDYADVSREQKWRDLEGFYTRYGDVLPLLTESDDKYVILNAGDEISIQFDASDLASPKPGWRRDFLIYTDGWIKDGDLNTAEGRTVEPLPFHDMSRYPYAADETYPADTGHQAYLRKYNTRLVKSKRF